MFDSLSDRIKQDEGVPAHKWEQPLRYLMYVAVAFLLFGGLYMVIQHLEG